MRGGGRLLRVQGGFELRADLRGVRRRGAKVQGLGNHFVVRWVPLGFGLQRCYAKLQPGEECLRTAAFVRRIGGELRSERDELLHVEYCHGRDDRLVLSEL